jgi:hypothetical protein
MIMKNLTRFLFPGLGILILTGMLISSCGQADQTMYKAKVVGFVVDSVSGLPLQSAQVICNTFSVMTYTDTAGRFYFSEIEMPRGEWTAYFTASQYGYISKSVGSYIDAYHLNVIDTIKLLPSLK